MKQFFTLATLLISLFAQAQSFEWVNYERIYAHTPAASVVATDDTGNVYKFTSYAGTMDVQGDTLENFPNNIYPHLYLLKYSPAGTLLWSKTFGTCYVDVVGEISVDDAGHIYISMQHQCDTIFFEDTTVYTGYHANHLIQFNNNGNYLRRLTYSIDYTIHHTTLGNDLYTSSAYTVTKYDTAFNIIWQQTMNPISILQLSGFGRDGDIYVNDNGHLVVCGFEGGAGTFQFDTISMTFDGAFNHVGIISMDTSGTAFWGRSFTAGSAALTYANAVDDNGNVYWTITTDNQFVFANDTLVNTTGINQIGAVLKYAASGNPQWAVPLYSNNTTPSMNDLLINDQQEILLAAQYSSYSNGGTFGGMTLHDGGNALISKIFPNGTVAWIKHDQIPNSGSGNAFSLALLPNNRYAVAGLYTAAIDNADGFGCFPASLSNNSYTAVVSELPEAPAPGTFYTFTSDDLTVTFNNQTTSGTSNLWNFGNGDTSAAASPTYTFSAAGTYNVCLTSTNPCGDSTYCMSITVTDVGVHQVVSDFNVKLFPNPVDNILFIATSINGSYIVTVNALVGKTFTSFEANNETEIDLSGYSDGIYCVKIEAANHAKTFMVVKD